VQPGGGQLLVAMIAALVLVLLLLRPVTLVYNSCCCMEVGVLAPTECVSVAVPPVCAPTIHSPTSCQRQLAWLLLLVPRHRSLRLCCVLVGLTTHLASVVGRGGWCCIVLRQSAHVLSQPTQPLRAFVLCAARACCGACTAVAVA
jgi:hypothetical protein